MSDIKFNEESKTWVDSDLEEGRYLSHPPPGEEIVISGMSGAFPESSNINEFMHNLYNKVDMVTPSRRWNVKIPEIPVCSGSLPDIASYDAGFFGVHNLESDQTSPMSRLLQEKVIEAIFDAGMHPLELKNTNTGVFIAVGVDEAATFLLKDNLVSNTSAWTGIAGCVAQKIGHFLKLKGPAITMEANCSSSFSAIEHAYRALRTGYVDTAIVGGVNLVTHPILSIQCRRLGVLSLDGKCKTFDENGKGFARSETAAILILQKAKHCKRVYAEIVHVKVNSDGFKSNGIIFPSREAQALLGEAFYQECQIDPSTLSYLEAHGTGTFVGDSEECGSIDDVFTKGRSTPLLIGAVKSNVGHSEAASGLCGIIKGIIALEHGYIPPNLHFKKARKEIQGILEGRLKVVTEKMPFQDDGCLIGVNNFGFGGTNGHILLRKNRKEKINSGIPEDNLPRLICVSGRTSEAVKTLLDGINSGFDAEYIRLLHDAFRENVSNHNYRGYTILSKSGEIDRLLKPFIEQRTLYLVFGELENWREIGSKLMELPPFYRSIYSIHKILLKRDIDIVKMFAERKPNRQRYYLLGNIVVQIAIIDLFKLMKINSIHHVGCFYGELLLRYHNNIYQLEEIVNYALAFNEAYFAICQLFKNSKFMKNTKEEKITHFSIQNWFLNQLKLAEVSTIKKQVLKIMSEILSVSTVLEVHLTEKIDALAENFTAALCKYTTFVTDNIENDAFLLCVGTVLMAKKSEENLDIVSLFANEQKDPLVEVLKALGQIYVNGQSLELGKLYPNVEFPVSRGTKMISPLIKWNHDRKWFVPRYRAEQSEKLPCGSRIVDVLLNDKNWSFLTGHIIDGQNILPITGYLWMVWETFAILGDLDINCMTVIFEDCELLKNISIPETGYLSFNVTISSTGSFEIVQSNSIVVTGKIKIDEDDAYTKQTQQKYSEKCGMEKMVLKQKDIYKELRLRGYNYKDEFRGIQFCNLDASEGFISWNNNWVTFLENMLQMKFLQIYSRQLHVPIRITKLKISAKNHMDWIKEHTKNNELLDIHVFCNPTAQIIRSEYIEINGLEVCSTPRVKVVDNPVLEKHVFVPNIASLKLEESIRVNLLIIIENVSVYRIKSLEIIDNFTPEYEACLSTLIRLVLKEQPMLIPSTKVYSTKPVETNIPVESFEKMSTGIDNVLIIVSRVFERPKIFSNALEQLKDEGYIISRECADFHIPKKSYSTVVVLTIHKTPSETLVLLKKRAETLKTVTIKISGDDFSWISSLQQAIKIQRNNDILLYAENEPTNGILGLLTGLRKEPDISNIRCVFLLDNSIKFSLSNPKIAEQLQKNLAINIFKNGEWGTYRHLPINDTNELREHCLVNSLNEEDFSSIKWTEGHLRHNMEVSENQKLVYTNYVALNYNKVTSSKKLERECFSGMEFSGMTQDGRRVLGISPSGGLSTLVVVEKTMIVDIPQSMSLAEAATIPMAYGIVIYGLIMQSDLKRGDSILIHSGTEDVGQAAIRIALHYGCDVFTTVETDDQETFLKTTFPQLQGSHIGKSQNLYFEQLIKRKTRGKGVQLVLNSFAGQRLDSSIRCLSRGGTIVEIGNCHLSNIHHLNFLVFEKEARFLNITLDCLFREDNVKKINKELTKGIDEGYIKPLNRHTFQFHEVDEAYRYMTCEKPMGKVLVEIKPETKICDIPSLYPCVSRYCTDPSKSYVIVGGLGGIGLELANWLIDRGAKNIVLSSREGITNGYQHLRVRTWKLHGIKVHVCVVDVTTEKGCQKLLNEANNLGPVDAIFNLAATLADALFENQTRQNFELCFRPKAVATHYLDKISRKLCNTLRNFVAFSSFSCGHGSSGQTPYGMANSVMERICEKRKEEGYPALVIQWGLVGEVGIVNDMLEKNIQVKIEGTQMQSIFSCLNLLDKFLTQTEAVIVSSMLVVDEEEEECFAGNITDAVMNILAVEANNVSMHSTLAELGMDSMSVLEIKQTLERKFNVFLSARVIRELSLAKLKDVQEQNQAKTSDTMYRRA